MSAQEHGTASPSPISTPNPSASTPATSCSEDHRMAPNRLDLDKYIALGCLGYTPSRNVRERSHDECWVEVDETSELPEDSVTNNIAALILAHWIRVFHRESLGKGIYRVFVLADDESRATVERGSKSYQKMLLYLLPSLDVSQEMWNGSSQSTSRKPFELWATAERCSLFYLFNTLNSPDPDPGLVSTADQYSSMSMASILARGDSVYGLKTCLYPYQKRAAAMMLQKESCPQLQLDPRMEHRVSPNGQSYYYGSRDLSFRKEPVRYETVRGGILAESMGLGKSLICIALILASKGQAPSVPPHCSTKIPVRQEVGSLSDMAAATIARSPIPWRACLDWRYNRTGEDMDSCIDAMDNQQPPPEYEIPPQRIRSTRHGQHIGPSERRRLCNATIVVVPPNLVHQWQSELRKHTEQGALDVLVLKNPKDFLPPVEQLCNYDIILFSRKRFEREARQGQSDTEDIYVSALKLVHFLRIIIDEGHGFSSASTNAGLVAEKVVRAERRWIVSGTPAKDLLGVEVETAAMELSGPEASLEYRQRSLEQRRTYDRNEETASGAAKALGALASRFLRAQPWAANCDDLGERRAQWDDYIYRHEHRTSRTYSGFSSCLRSTLQNLVVKTQPVDIERDLELPPLQHKIVRLPPSAVDKMTANLFVLLYTTNAITSERKDQDYLFHGESRAHLQRLTSNLRQSAFYWVGLDKTSVLKSVEVAEKYLDRPEKDCSEEDRQTLLSTVEAARVVLASPVWNAITQSTEMGAFARDWPPDLKHSWALEGCVDPMLLGMSQVVSSQGHVNSAASDPSAIADLNKEGHTANSLTPIKPASIDDRASGSPAKPNGNGAKAKPGETSTMPTGVPSSGLSHGPSPSRLIAKGRALPSYHKRKSSSAGSPHADDETQDHDTGVERSPPDVRRIVTVDDIRDQLTSTELIGTASTKLSYLIDRVHALCREEKVLIFYEGNHVAWYVSQALDLVNVKHLIYSNTLSSDVRSKYLALFDSDPHHRVLVMDIKQAAHGLNLSRASRVFFVNPPNQPDVEAQAIKRAHRIGQTRPVHAETLILEGTVEEAMFDRARTMTKREHLAAKSLEDDTGIRRILQRARTIPLTGEEAAGQNQMAPLGVPQRLFFRGDRERREKTGLEREIFGEGERGSMAVGRKALKKKGDRAGHPS